MSHRINKPDLFLKRNTFFFLILISQMTFVWSQNIEPDGKLVLLFAGDIMGHNGQIKGAYDADSDLYDYVPTFKYIKDYISHADIAIGNLEVTLGGAPYSGYPQFSSPDALGVALKDAGFDILVTANNHALDRGESGFLRTLDKLDSLDFFHAGTYRDAEERDAYHPLIFEKNNIRIALLNYTYGTNGLTIDTPLLINRIDKQQIGLDIIKAKKLSPDYIIVFIHWGNEYERNENSQQKELASYIFSKGADIIIGSHPHVIQHISSFSLKEKPGVTYPVVYSLGNFVSNQREQYRDGGIIAELYLSKKNSETKMDSLCYLPFWVWRNYNPDEAKSAFYIVPVGKFEYEPELFKFSSDDKSSIRQFILDTREHLTPNKESSFFIK